MTIDSAGSHFLQITIPQDTQKQAIERLLSSLNETEQYAVREDGQFITLYITGENLAQIQKRATELHFKVEKGRIPSLNNIPSLENPNLGTLLEAAHSHGAKFLALAFSAPFTLGVVSSIKSTHRIVKPCGFLTRVGSDYGEGSAKTSGSTPNGFLHAEAKAIQAARADAIAEATSALQGLMYVCEYPCQPVYTIILGEPSLKQIPLISGGISIKGFGISGPASFKILAYVAWEVTFACVTLTATTNDDTSSEASASSTTPPTLLECGEVYKQEGIGHGTKSSGVWISTSAAQFIFNWNEAYGQARQRALDEAMKDAQEQIAKLLPELPSCPTVSCPHGSIEVTYGNPTFTVTKSDYGVYKSFEVSVNIPWVVLLTCKL